ncbi:hypothetical protein B5E84_12645 [Lachnoclostridium sp. An14]|uniref:glycosyltransferase family 8 protein n=1 Tax=Lachnoclostridium sp. An14 TaxID=1965562 RepID=UPI000B36801A|nr:glycosyltransferase family 8 protein [Lachnoclostridium sp. An14]OUQ16218.1 hypothetical protein B5E84_12645 [Lachnoclostridium sp. An14]
MNLEKNVVVYSCDDGYVWILGISLISLLENNKDLTIFILGYDIQEKNKELLIKIAAEYDVECIVLNVYELCNRNFSVSGRWPSIAFVRLFMADILPEYIQKVLYLDCDTLVMQNITALFEMNMEGYVFRGVQDCISRQYKKNIGLNTWETYVNGGVLLVDLAALREFNTERAVKRFFNQYSRRMTYADQDVLNGVFRGMIGILPPEYNVMTVILNWSYQEIYRLRKPTSYYSEKAIAYSKEKPAIVHFTQNLCTIRPWYQNSNHPMANQFQKYKDISPWKDEVPPFFNDKGIENKQIKILKKLPRTVFVSIVGFFHAICYPFFIRLRAEIFGRNKYAMD